MLLTASDTLKLLRISYGRTSLAKVLKEALGAICVKLPSLFSNFVFVGWQRSFPGQMQLPSKSIRKMKQTT